MTGRPAGDDRGLLGPALGSALFVLLVPGSLIVLLPYWLSGWRFEAPWLGWSGTRWIGVILILLALPVFANFVLRFVREGRGTPAPVAPPRHLVVGGVFRYVRNPGYVAAISLVLGQALLFGSVPILLLAAGGWLFFHLFVVLYEEPDLRRRFGPEYEEYCRRVPRWIPARPRGSSGPG
jgi:protein-S-isoprenylcysteine O-methyltransferase Ste14